MGETENRKFDWLAALAQGSGGAVLVPSLAAVVVGLLAVTATLFSSGRKIPIACR